MFESIVSWALDIWEWATTNIAQISLGILVFLLFFLLRRQLSKLFSNIGKKLFNKRPEIAKGIKEALLGPSKFFCVFLGLYLGFLIMAPGTKIITFITMLFRVSVIITLTWTIANFTPSAISLIMKNKESKALNAVAVQFLANVAKIVIYALGIVVIISEVGYDITGLITGLGLGGLTFSLAAQDTAKNLFSGFAIISDKPFDVGDRISTVDLDGTVEEITMRSTRIRTFSDTVVVVPNASLVDSPITNWSRMNKRFSEITIGLTYDTSTETLHKCIDDIDEMLHEHSGVDDERILVTFNEFSDSSLDIQIIFYTKPTGYDDYLRVCENVNFKIKDIVEGNGASFAFPSTSVYVETKNEI